MAVSYQLVIDCTVARAARALLGRGPALRDRAPAARLRHVG